MVAPVVDAWHRQPHWLKTLATWSGLILLLAGLASGLMSWPHEDEANYLIQARWISEGQVPYRDFFEFIPPAGQYLTGLLYRMFGFSIIGIRFLVLTVWVVEIMLLYKLARQWIPPVWCWLLVGFLWVTDTRYIVHQHHFWSGFCALAATYYACCYLQGEKPKSSLMLSGFLAGLSPWITQSSGGLTLIGFAGFVLLTQQQVLKDWLRYWLLPATGVSLFWIVLLIAQGAWTDFLKDAVLWLMEGNYSSTTSLGYFVTLGEELHTTILPLLHPLSWFTKLFYAFRLPILLQLVLLATLPVIGVIGLGTRLWKQPKPFDNKQQQLLLLTIMALMLVVATCSYSTSMHLTSNGGLGILCGFLALQPVLSRFNWSLILGWLLCALLQLQAVIGSVTILFFGTWLPPLPTLPYDTLVFSYGPEDTQNYLATVWYLNDAAEKGESVFTFSQSQSLYLASPVKNATRFRLVLPLYTPPPQQEEIVRDLQENKPLYIVNDQSLNSIGRDPRFARYTQAQLQLPLIQTLIDCNYTLLNQHGRYLIYRRNTDKNAMFTLSCP